MSCTQDERIKLYEQLSSVLVESEVARTRDGEQSAQRRRLEGAGAREESELQLKVQQLLHGRKTEVQEAAVREMERKQSQQEERQLRAELQQLIAEREQERGVQEFERRRHLQQQQLQKEHFLGVTRKFELQ